MTTSNYNTVNDSEYWNHNNGTSMGISQEIKSYYEEETTNKQSLQYLFYRNAGVTFFSNKNAQSHRYMYTLILFLC